MKEVNDLTHYDPQKGTTMLGLYEAAQAKKVEVAAVRIGIEELCRTTDYKITFVDGDHFLVVCGCDKEKIYLKDPFNPDYS